MVLASHQPDFLPYMGFFFKAACCDTLVFSDDVLYSKKGMHNWNKIKTPNGLKKLTIPIHAHHDMRLSEIAVADIQRGIIRAVKTINQYYRRAPHYDEGVIILRDIISFSNRHFLTLPEFNIPITLSIMKRFGICPRILIASEHLHLSGRKDERIFQMCETLKADTYLSGTGAAEYHQQEEYEAHGIELVYAGYFPVEYPQLYGSFLYNLSVIDYIFNCGFKLPESWGFDDLKKKW